MEVEEKDGKVPENKVENMDDVEKLMAMAKLKVQEQRHRQKEASPSSSSLQPIKKHKDGKQSTAKPKSKRKRVVRFKQGKDGRDKLTVESKSDLRQQGEPQKRKKRQQKSKDGDGFLDELLEFSQIENDDVQLYGYKRTGSHVFWTNQTRKKPRFRTDSLAKLNAKDHKELRSSFQGRLALKLVRAFQNEGFKQHCIYEWFYSHVDEDFFFGSEQNDFVHALSEIGFDLPQSQKLTRTEWSILRSKISKLDGRFRCRRFSGKLLKEQRSKLEQHREKVRFLQKWNRWNDRSPDMLAGPVPISIKVGMRVTVFHLQALELATGVVLSANQRENSYIVQFDDITLGVMRCPDYMIRPCGMNCFRIATPSPHSNELANAKRLDTNLLEVLEILLSRKESLLTEMKFVHGHVTSNVETKISKEFVHIYQWLLDALSQTNENIRITQNQLHDRESFTQRSSSAPSAGNGPKSGWTTMFAQYWLEFARKSLPESTASSNDRLLPCVALLWAVKHCSEVRLSSEDINACLDSILNLLQPTVDLRTNVFLEIQSLMNLVKAACAPEPEMNPF